MKKLEMKKLDDMDSINRVMLAMFEKNGPQTIVIKNLVASMREAQRGLYWLWVGVIGSDIGNSKEEQHFIFKEKFLLNIYLNDPDEHPEFVDLVENMLIIRKNSPNQYQTVRHFVINNTSHMDASKKNMMEYLSEISAFARDMQIRLPAPERDGML